MNRTDADELLAVSQSPGVVGEVVSLDLLGGGSTLEMKVQVLDSRPVVVNGAVRHRLRLGMIPAVVGDTQQAEPANVAASCAGTSGTEAS